MCLCMCVRVCVYILMMGVNACIIIVGVSLLPHFLGGKCGNRDIMKRLIASFPGVANSFFAIDPSPCHHENE